MKEKFAIFNNNLIIKIKNKKVHHSIRWATKRAGGSSKNGRDSMSKRLGVKKFGGYLFSTFYLFCNS